jgi:hypothetical protein
VRSACQHPQLLEDVLIDFPGLTVVGAHMGHPYEALLIGYMLKWPQLHLMTSAFLSRRARCRSTTRRWPSSSARPPTGC